MSPDAPDAAPADKRLAGFLFYCVLFSGATLVFWLFREQSHSGDWRNWIQYVESGMWYRLREPVCLALYQVPYLALKPLGATAANVLAGFSYVCGGLSVCLWWATLGLMTSDVRLRWLGTAGLLASYGVTGIFFGHLEHYNVMSVGVFAYVYLGGRYLTGSGSIAAAGLALGLLACTHLMAAWLVPSLVALPWLGERSRRPLRDLTSAGLAFAIPNVAVWLVILFTYYRGSPASLLEDAATGSFSKEHHGVGNALGGGNNKGFLTPAEIFSPGHARAIATLLFVYSPVACVLALWLLVKSPAAALRRLAGAAWGRFFLWLLVPYLVYMITWEAGLGYGQDWDLFSHVTIFLLGATLFLVFSESRWSRGSRLAVAAGLAVSVAMSGFLVAATHHPDSPTGIHRVLESLGVQDLSRETPAPAPGVAPGARVVPRR